MSEMIERVAEALVKSRRLPDGSLINWDVFRADARAAIEALREPTPEILKAMWRRNDDNDAEEATLENWRDAIDAALGHPHSP